MGEDKLMEKANARLNERLEKYKVDEIAHLLAMKNREKEKYEGMISRIDEKIENVKLSTSIPEGVSVREY